MARVEEILSRSTSPRAADAVVVSDDLAAPALYLNRELTWLAFERRGLHEAPHARDPPLQRLQFPALTPPNPHAVFMKRLGGPKQQLAPRVQERTVDGRTPQQQIVECYAEIHDLEREQRTLLVELLRLLAERGITICGYERLSAGEQAELRARYLENVFPLMTPLAIDPAHP